MVLVQHPHPRDAREDRGVAGWSWQIISQDLKDNKITTRIEVDLSQPLGVASWRTKSALRGIIPAGGASSNERREAGTETTESQRRNEVNGDERREGRVRASRGR